MRLILLAFLSFVGLTIGASQANAFTSNMPIKMTDTLLDLSTMEVSPHELALTQVLAEICPAFLNAPQKQKFQESYKKQLQALMPEFDPTLVMTQMNRQKEYRNTLKSVRAWTVSYPKEENRALCVEFAENTIY